MNTKTCKDHTGRKFASVTAMCKAWGISPDVFDNRKRRGWSLEESLTTPKGKNLKKPIIKDHLGNTYRSIEEMCNHYGISDSTYSGRINNGYSVEEALTMKTDDIKNRHVKDHLGNEFPSIRAMCKHWNVETSRYFGRRKIGWPLEKILTTEDKIVYPENTIPAEDHLGNKFPSENEMCKFWGIPRTTYRLHIKQGWSVEKALTTKKRDIKIVKQPCVDHEGNEFSSINDMCKHWNITRQLYSSRIKLGWSVEKALTTKELVINSVAITDYLGRTFPSLIDICNFYRTPEYMLQGKKQTEKLMKKVYTYSMKPGATISRYTIIKKLTFPYFVVERDNEEIICDIETLLDEYHNSEDFKPIPKDAPLTDVTIVKCIHFPYYEIKFKGESQVWTYWQLINYRRDNNYCIGATQTRR